MGVNWVGPTIMRHGTPEQQALGSVTAAEMRAYAAAGARREGSPAQITALTPLEGLQTEGEELQP